MKELSGVIVKGIGGFYYVDTKMGIVECRARGLFRKKGFTPLVGDSVVISLDEESAQGYVSEILPRTSELIRPAVSNVTQMVVVVAQSSPAPNLYVLDKLIASAEFAKLKVVICFNKSDLEEDAEIIKTYKNAGFQVVETSAVFGTGIEKVKEILKDETTVFAGNSGVGKSSLLNAVMGVNMFETGVVSEKLERGKHTTRHSELVRLPFGGYIVDTPGFSSFDVNKIPNAELAFMFREFESSLGECRFLDCSHTVEPDCDVIRRVENGEISKSRHESYVQLYREIKEANKL
ncbi:MAG: ribosome small subunit-dependent GTPase A [Clostridia bacterium]|nr:ribosome small subunit-dependent GTPase A [Clostridia bacterium]